MSAYQEANTLTTPLLTGVEDPAFEQLYPVKSSSQSNNSNSNSNNKKSSNSEIKSSSNPDGEEVVSRFGWLDSLIVWIISPGLLWIDFSIAFWLEPELTRGLDRTTVNTSIIMFVISAYLYRKTIEDLNIRNIFVVLIPEISMDIVLTMVLCNEIVLAFMSLLVCILMLASFVVIHSVHMLFSHVDDEEKSDENIESEVIEAKVCHYEGPISRQVEDEEKQLLIV